MRGVEAFIDAVARAPAQSERAWSEGLGAALFDHLLERRWIVRRGIAEHYEPCEGSDPCACERAVIEVDGEYFLACDERDGALPDEQVRACDAPLVRLEPDQIDLYEVNRVAMLQDVAASLGLRRDPHLPSLHDFPSLRWMGRTTSEKATPALFVRRVTPWELGALRACVYRGPLYLLVVEPLPDMPLTVCENLEVTRLAEILRWRDGTLRVHSEAVHGTETQRHRLCTHEQSVAVDRLRIEHERRVAVERYDVVFDTLEDQIGWRDEGQWRWAHLRAAAADVLGQLAEAQRPVTISQLLAFRHSDADGQKAIEVMRKQARRYGMPFDVPIRTRGGPVRDKAYEMIFGPGTRWAVLR